MLESEFLYHASCNKTLPKIPLNIFDSDSFRIPIHLIILDMIGAILFALGIIEWLTNIKFVPVSLQFNMYEFVLIVAGILLMLPFIHFLTKLVLSKLHNNF